MYFIICNYKCILLQLIKLLEVLIFCSFFIYIERFFLNKVIGIAKAGDMKNIISLQFKSLCEIHICVCIYTCVCVSVRSSSDCCGSVDWVLSCKT